LSNTIRAFRSWWVADLVDISSAFDGTRRDIMSRQSLEALQQIYGYMTFNDNKFGIQLEACFIPAPL